jgi:hypothetical protein
MIDAIFLLFTATCIVAFCLLATYIVIRTLEAFYDMLDKKDE